MALVHLIDHAFGPVRQIVSDFFDDVAEGQEDAEPAAKKVKLCPGLPVRIQESDFVCREFTGHETLHRFFVDVDGQVSESKQPPVVDVNSAYIHKGRNLREGWELNALIRDYISFSNMKGQLFKNMLQKEEKFAWIWNSSENPVFVGSAGVFSLMMKCPFDVVQLSSSVWNVCTWMENGAIFFKEMHEVRNEANAVTYSDRGKWNPKHMRLNFYRMLFSCGKSARMNEHEKHFKISKVYLNDYCLVTQDEVNAVDREGHDIKVVDRRCKWDDEQEKEHYYSTRYLQMWAYAQLAGQRKIIQALKLSNKLQDVKVFDASTSAMVDHMERELAPNGRNRVTWSPDQACDFLYRLLFFVKELLTDPRTIEGRVIQLSYKRQKTSFIQPKFLSLEESEDIKLAHI